jgi:methylenetetrahydrofolate dehydrogenase (NADP+)/methenyltetrahydrofolate cyclohydrolase
MVADFMPGPTLTSEALVGPRLERLTLLSQALGEQGVYGSLDIVASNPEESGNESFIRSFELMGDKAEMDISIHRRASDESALRIIRNLNVLKGSTHVMVPGQDPSYTDKFINANEREVEGTRPGSKHEPATPAGMLDLTEFALGGPLDQVLKNPNHDVAVVGHTGQVGSRVVDLLGDRYHITPRLVGHSDAEKKEILPTSKVILTAAGRPGVIHAGYWKAAVHGADSPEAFPGRQTIIDAGVKKVDGKLRGDVAPGLEEVAGDVMYTPTTGAVGPLNTEAVLRRALIRAALQSGISKELIAEMQARIEQDLRDKRSKAQSHITELQLV